ncbi:hypothetical protein Tco_1218243 [Tanacetum coccineum]
MTTLHDLIALAMLKKEEEKELQESKRLKSATGRFPFVMIMMTRDYDHSINTVLFINRGTLSSKVMEIVIPEVGRIEDDILLIKDDTLRETLLNVNRLVAKIEALKDNPVPSPLLLSQKSLVVASTTPSELLFPDYKVSYMDNVILREECGLELPLLMWIFLNMIRSSLIFRMIQFPPVDRSDFYHELVCSNYPCRFHVVVVIVLGLPGFVKTSGSGYQQKDRKPSQNDKTEHGMEKTVQNQGQSPKMPKSESILKNQQSNRSRN